MTEPVHLPEQHNFIKDFVFHAKSSGLIFSRFLKNTFLDRPEKFRPHTSLRDADILAISESSLWNADDNAQNWILTAGKIENLRVAVRKLNGLEIPANNVFSFWKQVAYPGRVNGFVTGREIREGCIVPTIAGGLCQLSNALYDAALKAGFKILERHKHTRVIKGSLAEIDRDATVKWNYLDLRFSSPHPFRIEIELTSTNLIVKFRSWGKKNCSAQHPSVAQAVPSFLNDCYSCGNVECFKHPSRSVQHSRQGKTTFILDERWPEYEAYVQQSIAAGDELIVPFSARQRINISRFTWQAPPKTTIKSVPLHTLYQSLKLRLFSKTKRNLFAMMMQRDQFIAQRMARQIPVASTHLVIAQNFLPYVWASGVLGGRTFDVLMTRLPLERLHQRLDFAYSKFSESPTLHDFRASDQLVKLETDALNASRKIITPHSEIAEIFNHKSILVEWKSPEHKKMIPSDNVILFPASSLGRKGAYETRGLARELDLKIRVIGKATESDGFWSGVNVEHSDNNIFDGVRAVVYPAYIEHQPRLILRAIAYGITVITTTATGISPADNVIIVPVGDYHALKEAFAQLAENVTVV